MPSGKMQVMSTMSRPRIVLALALLLGLLTASAFADQEAAAAPLLTLEEVTVEPTNPGPDTLCKLRVKLRNAGTQIASQLDFGVSINGQALPVYRNQLFMYPVAAGETAEIKLYNFWSTETFRPFPTDGKMKVEVTLRDARWMTVEEDEEKVEVWTPQGAVEGLPVSRSVTLTMVKPAGG